MTVDDTDETRIKDDARATGVPHIRTLLLTDFVDSTALLETLGDERGAAVFGRSDRIVRDLVKSLDALEIDKTDGFLLLFRRPLAAVRFALAYHEQLGRLSESEGVRLEARVGIHVAEVVLRSNRPEDVARGAKPIEVEGLAKPMVARIMTLARGGQTLMSRPAYAMARRAVVGDATLPDGVVWIEHGDYRLKGVADAVEVCEVGVQGASPLAAPSDSDKAWHAKTEGDKAGRGLGPLVAAALGGAALVGGVLVFLQGGMGTAPQQVVRLQTEAPVDPEPKSPLAPPVPSTVALTITSQPPGAAVQFGGNAIGTTPITLQLPPGAGMVPVEVMLEGHHPRSVVCEVAEDQVSAGEANCEAILAPIEVKAASEKKPRKKKTTTIASPEAESSAPEPGSETTRKPNIQIIE